MVPYGYVMTNLYFYKIMLISFISNNFANFVGICNITKKVSYHAIISITSENNCPTDKLQISSLELKGEQLDTDKLQILSN